MSKTTEDMKAELVAAGYLFSINDYGLSSLWYSVETLDDWVFESWSESDVIKKAYAHLQKERELEALRHIVSKLAIMDVEDVQEWFNIDELIELENEAINAVKQYNITTEESE